MKERRILLLVLILLFTTNIVNGQHTFEKEIVATLKDHILAEAAWALEQKPVTVTDFRCARSAGGKHDFYSEGDYWWPDPENPNGPYIQKDGQTNPDNFVEHRHAMIRLSRVVGALASAYKITHDDKYVKQALTHASAWFVDTTTRMNPSLLYAQAIKGKVTGRGIGIIDTIQLMEVVQGLSVMERSAVMDKVLLGSVRKWFTEYVNWLMSHPYGKEEMQAENNHGTCWVMQVASFAKFTGNEQMVDFCRERYKDVLLPNQMAADGSFPRELKRTKPYGYSLFNLDAMTTICQILSDEKNDLWKYRTPDGKSIDKGIGYLFPFIEDKTKWPLNKDVMYWDQWPVAQPALAFGAVAFRNKKWLATWKQLEHAPGVDEVIRNLPIRNPVIWLN